MTIAETFLSEFDAEMATTRRVLERIPEENLAWKPHEKSMTLGRLAGHVAELPGLGIGIVKYEKFSQGSGKYTPLVVTSRQEALRALEENVAATRAALAAGSDADLMKPWSLDVQGKTLFTLPRIAALRGFMLRHLVHHRGQLSVYLRLNNVPVPMIYGPTADEKGF
jgi:uncharacterized damage-inducible protein DinB